MSNALSGRSAPHRRKGLTRPRVVAVVPSAGYGRRLGSRTRKPFVLLKGKPLIIHTLKVIDGSSSVDGIIIAAEKTYIRRFKELVRKFRLKKVIAVIAGGRTRYESVRNCLDAVDSSFDVVLIHDGARPFVTEPMIRDSVETADRYGGCIAAVPESDTVKVVGRDLFVTRTLDRARIYRAQTPQAFTRTVIVKAYAAKKAGPATDDAGLVELAGGKVKIIEGSYRNIKITTRGDLELAEVLL